MKKTDINKIINSWFKSKTDSTQADSEDIFSAGLIDSFSVIELINFCENEFKIKFDSVDFQKDEFRTIEGIASIISNKLDNV